MKMESRAFRSVKEAVDLYGKRISAPELHSNVLQQMEREASEVENYASKIKSVSIELKEAKENLQKAKERSLAMAHSISSLQEELEDTKRKLRLLKHPEFDEIPSEIEDVKVVDDRRKFDREMQIISEEEEGPGIDGNCSSSAETFRNSPSLMKKKKKIPNDMTKKSSISMMGGIFSRKK